MLITRFAKFQAWPLFCFRWLPDPPSASLSPSSTTSPAGQLSSRCSAHTDCRGQRSESSSARVLKTVGLIHPILFSKCMLSILLWTIHPFMFLINMSHLDHPVKTVDWSVVTYARHLQSICLLKSRHVFNIWGDHDLFIYFFYFSGWWWVIGFIFMQKKELNN